MYLSVLYFVTLCLGCFGYPESTLILPRVPLGPHAPRCTSYNSLCHIAFNISVPDSGVPRYEIVHSDQQICRCPHNIQCEIGWHQTENSIIKQMKNSGRDMMVKMSYCRMPSSPLVCRANAEALTMRGNGPLLFEFTNAAECRCYRSLFEHRSWMEGHVRYVTYSCGKRKCPLPSPNRVMPSPCMRRHTTPETNYRHDYLCRCRINEECVADRYTSRRNVVHHTCQNETLVN